MTEGSPGRGSAPILPVDFGIRPAVRFYLTRLAVLAGLGLVAALVPAVAVLFQDGPHALGVSVVVLVLITLVVFRSVLRDRGALSPVSGFAPAPRRVPLRTLAVIIVRMLRRR